MDRIRMVSDFGKFKGDCRSRPPSFKTGVDFGRGWCRAGHFVCVVERRCSRGAFNQPDESAGRNLARVLGTNTSVVDWEKKTEALEDIGLLVNTTGLGMIGRPPLKFSLDGLGSQSLVADIVYAPLKTDLLKEAEESRKSNGRWTRHVAASGATRF